MVGERCLKKSFTDSLEDIKERMKQKRNKKWARLGKANQVLPIKTKIAGNSSAKLKSFKANNHALALALEEEKSKMREAQDIILHLKEEYQSLKCQLFVLQRKLQVQQEKECAENRFMTVKKIICKVVQDLLNAANIVDPINDVCTTAFNAIQHASELEECAPGSLKKHDSLTLLKHVLAAKVSKDKTEMQDKVNRIYSASPSNFYESTENTPPASQTDIGCPYSCEAHLEDDVNCGSRSISVNEDSQISYPVPRNVSVRRRYLRFNPPNELPVSDDDIPEIRADLCKDDKTLSKTCSGKNNEKCEGLSISQENKHGVNTDKRESHVQIESNATVFLEQNNFNNIGGFKKEKCQKRKLVTTKNMPRARSKKEKNRNKQTGSKPKADASINSSDAYDFVCEESVHITPFRQNKQNEHVDRDNTEAAEICSDESSVSEEDPNDSLYVPYSKKSKSKETLSAKTDEIAVCTRPRSKRTVCKQDDRNAEGKNRNTTTPESHLDETSKALQKHHHLSDITNIVSTSCQTRISHPAFSTAVENTRQRRRTTSYVSYKEPSLCGKLRRGDPFTDTSFLNSPIFKRDNKSKTPNKQLLSRYNEAFVGCH